MQRGSRPPRIPCPRRSAQTRIPLEEVPALTRIQPTGDALDIRQPAGQVPYGVVRVLAMGASRKQILGTRLVGMPEYETAHGSRVLLGQRQARRDPRNRTGPAWRSNYYVVAATPSTLAWFPAGEVEELLEQPSVADDVNLKRKIERLTDVLKRAVAT